MSAQIHNATETSEKTTIEFDSEPEQADVYVAETYVNRWGDQRAVLKGDTYNAKEAIKTDWEQTHWKPGEDSRGNFAWVVDASEESFDALEASLDEAGFSFDANAGNDEIPAEFAQLLDAASEDDEISVIYAKKNGNGTAAREGTVYSVHAEGPDGYLVTVDEFGERDDLTNYRLILETEENKTYTLKVDDSGKIGIYSSGYYPYMGAVESVDLVPVEDENENESDEENEVIAAGCLGCGFGYDHTEHDRCPTCHPDDEDEDDGEDADDDHSSERDYYCLTCEESREKSEITFNNTKPRGGLGARCNSCKCNVSFSGPPSSS